MTDHTSTIIWLYQWLQGLSSNCTVFLLAEHFIPDTFFPVLGYRHRKSLEELLVADYYRLPVRLTELSQKKEIHASDDLEEYIRFGRILRLLDMDNGCCRTKVLPYPRGQDCGRRLALLHCSPTEASDDGTLDNVDLHAPLIYSEYARWEQRCIEQSQPDALEMNSDSIIEDLARLYADESPLPPFYPVLDALVMSARSENTSPKEVRVVNQLSWHCHLLQLEKAPPSYLERMLDKWEKEKEEGKKEEGKPYVDDLKFEDDKKRQIRAEYERFLPGVQAVVDRTIDLVVPLGVLNDTRREWVIFARHNCACGPRRGSPRLLRANPRSKKEGYASAGELITQVWNQHVPESAVMTTYWAACRHKAERGRKRSVELLSLGMNARALKDALRDKKEGKKGADALSDVTVVDSTIGFELPGPDRTKSKPSPLKVRFHRLDPIEQRTLTVSWQETAISLCTTPFERAIFLLNKLKPAQSCEFVFKELGVSSDPATGRKARTWHAELAYADEGLFPDKRAGLPNLHDLDSGAWDDVLVAGSSLQTKVGDAVRSLSRALGLKEVACADCGRQGMHCWCLGVLKALRAHTVHPALIELATMDTVRRSTFPRLKVLKLDGVDRLDVLNAVRGVYDLRFLEKSPFSVREYLHPDGSQAHIIVRFHKTDEMPIGSGVASLLFHDGEGDSFALKCDKDEAGSLEKALGRIGPLVTRVSLVKEIREGPDGVAWERTLVLEFALDAMN